MNLKRIFGIVLTLLGIGGLIYAAMLFMNKSNEWRSLVVYAILGILFFTTGIGLIRNTKDDSRSTV